MIQDLLEILIITYNRGFFLENTLRELKQSPFLSCKITILDNCSTDNTPEICAKFREDFPQYMVVRRRINIGGNPNYLGAIELSKSPYTWILCDDDVLDFTHAEDIVKAVEDGLYDLVEVGAIVGNAWPRGTATSVRKLIKKNIGYHFGMSFFPAYIFKTELFDSACFYWGYNHIDLLYPQFGFLNKSLHDDFSIYLARKKIVTRNDVNDHSFLPFVWYASWVACCRSIESKNVRAQAIDDATTERGFFKCLLFWTALDRKLNKDGDFWSRVAEVFRTFNWRQRLKYLIVFPWVFLPVPLAFWVWTRKSIYQLNKVPESKIPPLRFLNR